MMREGLGNGAVLRLDLVVVRNWAQELTFKDHVAACHDQV